VEGGSGGVAASSGAVLWLEAEAREGTTGAASEQRRKHFMGEKNPVGDGSTLLKGGTSGATAEEGAGELGDAWGGVREREGGGRVRRETARAAGGRGWRCCRATAVGGGMRATDRQDRATAGPGGKRRGAG
jgi:hypothetical protein